MFEPIIAGVATSSLILGWLIYRWQEDIRIFLEEYKEEKKKLLHFLIATGFFFLFHVVFRNSIAGIISAILFFLIIRKREELKEQERNRVIESQAEVALQLIASFYENTGDIMAALKETADCIQPPLADELRLTVIEFNANIAPLKAIQNLADRVNNKDINIFVNAVILSERYGTDTAQVIEDVSNKIAERITLRDELKNEAWGQSIQLKIFFLALPIVTILLMLVPDVREVLTTSLIGKGIIILLLLIMYYAWSFATNQEVINEL